MASKNIRRWIKRALLIGGALLLVGLIVIASLPQPVPVDVSAAEVGALEVTVDEDGRTRVKDRHVVSAPLSGSLARIELVAGDRVTTGDVLARIAPMAAPLLDDRSRSQAHARVRQALAQQRQTSAGVDRAEAALRFAEQQLARQEALARAGAVAESTLEQARLEQRSRAAELTSAEFARRVADSDVQMAQAAVGSVEGRPRASEQLEVTAPVDGVVLRVLTESEGVVQTGQPLLEIGDSGALEVVVDVLSADAVAIEPGAAVRIDGWGGNSTLEGRVRRVEPGAFSRVSALGVEEQRVNVVIDFTSPPSEWQRLGDGFRVEAHIVLWREDSVLKVPSSALFRRDGAWALYRVRADTAELVVVEVGRNNGLEAEIVGGLEAGDRVVVHPGESITDGVSLAPRGNPS